MNCKHCNSENVTIKDRANNRYKCKDCGRSFVDRGEVTESRPVKPKSAPKSINISELRRRHDVDFKVTQTLKSLKKDQFIEKEELIKRVGLRPGYPRLSATIDSYKEYFGRADSKIYWGHPEDIAALKEEGTLF